MTPPSNPQYTLRRIEANGRVHLQEVEDPAWVAHRKKMRDIQAISADLLARYVEPHPTTPGRFFCDQCSPSRSIWVHEEECLFGRLSRLLVDRKAPGSNAVIDDWLPRPESTKC